MRKDKRTDSRAPLDIKVLNSPFDPQRDWIRFQTVE